VHSAEVDIETGGRGVTDITEHVRTFCGGLGDGLVNVFAPHSTVGLALAQIGEGSGEDILAALHRLIPRDLDYRHQEKAPGHGADHIVPVIATATLTIPVVDGVPMLGTFQQVIFLDLDEQPTRRKIRLSFVG
jgi:secondary thiamine-phosphate synthase enzyme